MVNLVDQRAVASKFEEGNEGLLVVVGEVFNHFEFGNELITCEGSLPEVSNGVLGFHFFIFFEEVSVELGHKGGKGGKVVSRGRGVEFANDLIDLVIGPGLSVAVSHEGEGIKNFGLIVSEIGGLSGEDYKKLSSEGLGFGDVSVKQVRLFHLYFRGSQSRGRRRRWRWLSCQHSSVVCELFLKSVNCPLEKGEFIGERHIGKGAGWFRIRGFGGVRSRDGKRASRGLGGSKFRTLRIRVGCGWGFC